MKLTYIFYIYNANNVNLSKNIVNNNVGSYLSSTAVTEWMLQTEDRVLPFRTSVEFLCYRWNFDTSC
jgi:hypothetical protein